MKILIVGGGPAGSATAISLLEHNPSAEVYIVERKWGPQSICAGGLGIEAYRKVNEHVGVPKEHVEHVIRSFEICVKNTCLTVSAEDLGTDMLGVVIDRKSFDRHLLRKAEKMGATVVHSIPLNKRFNYVVDARGAESAIKHVPKHEVDITVQYYVKHRIDRLKIVFDGSKTKYGYLWFFPSRNTVKAGFGRSLTEERKDPIRSYAEKHGYTRVEGKPLPLYKPLPLISGRTLKVGTAAGLVCAVTGAGIVYAVESGWKAGEALAKNKPEKYPRSMWKTLAELKLRYAIKKTITPINPPTENTLSKLLKHYFPKTPNVRKEIMRLLLQLVKTDPKAALKLLYHTVNSLT